jgi:predicted nucleotide-binding protein
MAGHRAAEAALARFATIFERPTLAASGPLNGAWDTLNATGTARPLSQHIVSRNKAIMPTPLMFIGSSTESRHIADALQENLRDDLDVFVWSQLGFLPSRDAMTSLERSLDESDFAASIFAPDDDLLSRGDITAVVRDNVLFECGLFMGRLGRERTFIVQPASSTNTHHIPTDLFGLTVLTYAPDALRGSEDDKTRALLKAANEIRVVARRLKRMPRSAQRRVDGVLSRGSTASIASVADGAIHVADKRHEYFQTLRRYLRNGDLVPSKYLYWSPQGSSHWLELCSHNTYPYYRNSVALLRKHAKALVAQVTTSTGTAEIDLISVGSGDGTKDNILLRHLKDALYAFRSPVIRGRYVVSGVGIGALARRAL